MDNMVNDIAHFHTKFGLGHPGSPQALSEEMSDYRKNFLFEEVVEYADACNAEDLEMQLDALVDIVYVALGTAYLHGFNFSEAWRRVHAANMRKVRAADLGQTKRGTLFDIVKPDGWEPPDLSDLVK